MRLGCVIIPAPLAPNGYYKNSPFIQLADWSELMPLLANLLANPDRLHDLHLNTVNWRRQYCSESAVADYMSRTLKTP